MEGTESINFKFQLENGQVVCWEYRISSIAPPIANYTRIGETDEEEDLRRVWLFVSSFFSTRVWNNYLTAEEAMQGNMSYAILFYNKLVGTMAMNYQTIDFDWQSRAGSFPVN